MSDKTTDLEREAEARAALDFPKLTAAALQAQAKQLMGDAARAELDEVGKAFAQVEKANALVAAAEANRDEVCRKVLARHLVTQEQVAQVLGITPRGLRLRLGRPAR